MSKTPGNGSIPMSSKKQDRKATASRLTRGLLAATIAGLVAMPIAFANADGGPVAIKSASLAKQVKSLKKRVAALEQRTSGNTTTTTTKWPPHSPPAEG